MELGHTNAGVSVVTPDNFPLIGAFGHLVVLHMRYWPPLSSIPPLKYWPFY